ncbi:MAG: BACON domain-containing protein [Alistipes sp.]|jgi:hypothetical protein|nr:BACON domain-containing protein [Alistipes sp.]
MKKIFTLALAALSLGLASCSPEDNNPTPPEPGKPTLEVSIEGGGNSLIVNDMVAEGDEYTLTVSSNLDWTAAGTADEWLTVAPAEGFADEDAEGDTETTVTITVAANDSEETRTAEVVFTTTGDEPLTKTVTFSQLAKTEEEPEPDEPIAITEARMDHVGKNGSFNIYGLMFHFDNQDGTRSEIRLELTGEEFDDFLNDVPAAGTYEYTESFEARGLAPSSYFYPDADLDTGSLDYPIVGGKAVIAAEGDQYTIEMELSVAGGTEIQAIYEGPLRSHVWPEGVEGDTATTDWSDVTAEKYLGRNNMWRVAFENASGISVDLVVNTAADLEELPVGNYAMASAARAGVAGTAEPASEPSRGNFQGCWLRGDYDWQWNPDFSADKAGQWAIAGEGFVNITKEDNDYTIAYEFRDVDGNTISGSWTGELYEAQVEEFGIEFSNRNFNISDNSYGEGTAGLSLSFSHWDSATQYSYTLNIEAASTLMDWNDSDVMNGLTTIPAGNYSFDENFAANHTLGTFGTFTVSASDDRLNSLYNLSPTGGSFTVTHTEAGMLFEFDVLMNDGRRFVCDWEGMAW